MASANRPGIELARQEQAGAADHRAGGAHFQHLEQRGPGPCRPWRHHEAFLHQHAGGQEDLVVDELGERAGAGLAEMEDVLAEAGDEGAHRLEGRTIAAHHHRQLAGHGAGASAGNRRIEILHVTRARRLGNAAIERNGVGREVDDDGAGPRMGEYAVGAEHHLLDVPRPRQRQEDGCAIGGQCGDRRRAPRALVLERPRGLGIEIEHRQVVAGLHQSHRHRRADGARTYETRRRHVVLPRTCAQSTKFSRHRAPCEASAPLSITARGQAGIGRWAML
jgi:hypothetical protein